jgi:hypothetical protein
MSEQSQPDPDGSSTTATPETTTFLLMTFAEFYRQEVGAEEDVHRSLPFFGTALGLVIGALAYAAGRLPKWTDIADWRSATPFLVSAAFLILAVVEASFVLAVSGHHSAQVPSDRFREIPDASAW